MKKRVFSSQQAHLSINTGLILSAYFKEKKIYKSSLARTMNRADSGILQFQKGRTMRVCILEEISHALKHNFFQDLADILPKEYSKNGVEDTALVDKIALLEKQIELLTAEKEVLLTALKGR